ncbi:Zinc/iron permease [Lipomyces chichibuensis]|uniref:Zinc/iron permease n=1 Tax=Lipomyces chichibuensis TaxID=1546026 RepID=UPI003343678E
MQSINGLITLIILSILMGAASFGSGMLPLVVSLSSDRLRLVSTIGAGVLMGTSLIVIVPEGVETLYSTPIPRHALPGPIYKPQPPIDLDPPTANINDVGGDKTKRTLEYIRRQVNNFLPNHDDTSVSLSRRQTPVQNKNQIPTHKYVGVALIGGFILMYLIDKIPAYFMSNTGSYHNSVDVSELRTYSVSSGSSPSSMSPSDSQNSHSVSAMTMGFVIHAAADGIALGASAASSSLTLETIVFIAILLHKAPAAFGMTAVLLRTGMHRRTVKQHLLVFSLAAPIGALVTWVAIMIGGSNDGGTGIQWWTGFLLLFSGGTFLYVAIHVMNETAESIKFEVGGSSRPAGSIQDTAAAVAGMLIPLVTLLVEE